MTVKYTSPRKEKWFTGTGDISAHLAGAIAPPCNAEYGGKSLTSMINCATVEYATKELLVKALCSDKTGLQIYPHPGHST